MTEEKEINAAAQSEAAEKTRWTDRLLYNRSFIARLALADDNVRGYYAEIAKKLLGYKKVRSRLSWSSAGFSAGRAAFAKITISGKTLCLYLALDPETVTGKYKAKDAAGKKKYEKTPALLKIRSDGALRGAIRAIETCAAALGLVEKTDAGEVRGIPADSFDNLVTRGLIRIVRRAGAGKGVIDDAGDEIAATKVEEEETAEEHADEYALPELADEGAASATANYLDEIAKKYRAYEETLEAMGTGETSVEFREKLMLRAVDERWIEKIENALGAIDYLMRNPTHYIVETEEILPVEMTKKITGRSIAHLGQHSDNITVNEDGEITPKKLLNVFREDSILTYENKFLNTLIARLYLFVTRRCEIAKKYGADEKCREVNFTSAFREGFDRAKVTIRVEYDRKFDGSVRRTQPSTETRKRLEKLEAVVREYAGSEFVTQMEGKYVNPPILRTNAIVKNKYFRQCLELWDFVERYDDAGFGLTVAEKAIDPGDGFIAELGRLAAASYLSFRKNACGAADDNVLGSHVSPVIYPRVADEVRPLNPDEYNIIENAAEESGEEKETLAEPVADVTDDELAFAIEVALAADAMLPDPLDAIAVAPALQPADNTPETVENDEEEEEKFDFGGIKYVRTFHARIRLADEKTKEHYAAILNAFLKYDKVRVKESNRYCAVYYGRKTLAKINVTGKTLKLYLALDPATQDKKYFLKESGESKTYAAVPALMKVRSDRAERYAEELIKILVEKEGLIPAKKPVEPVLAAIYAPMTIDELLACGWMKRVDGEYEPQPELQPVDNLPETSENDEEEEEKFDFGGIKYVRTFHARIRLADEKTKEHYAAILNAFLKYDKVRVKESNRYCAVYYGRKTLAKINVTGKTLKLYLALDPATQDKKYFLKESGESKTYAAVPALMKVRSDRAERYAEELIKILVEKEGLIPAKKPVEPVLAAIYAPMTIDELLACGWMKELAGEETAESHESVKVVASYGSVGTRAKNDEIERTGTGNGNDDTKSEDYDEKVTISDESKEIFGELDEIQSSWSKNRGDADGHVEAAATVVPPAPEVTDAETENARTEVAKAAADTQTIPDVVQVAADYSKPTDFGVDDSHDFIEFIKPQPAKPDHKGFFKRLFSMFRKSKK